MYPFVSRHMYMYTHAHTHANTHILCPIDRHEKVTTCKKTALAG